MKGAPSIALNNKKAKMFKYVDICNGMKVNRTLFVCLFVFIYSLSLKLIVYKYTVYAFIIED